MCLCVREREKSRDDTNAAPTLFYVDYVIAQFRFRTVYTVLQKSTSLIFSFIELSFRLGHLNNQI